MESEEWLKQGEETLGRVRNAEEEQGKQVHFAEEEQPVEMRAQSTDDQDVMDGLEEVRAGRGSAGLVRGRGGQVSDRTRPAEKAKAKAMEAKESMERKEDAEAKKQRRA